MNLNFIKLAIMLWATWGLITLSASVKTFSLGNEEIPAPIHMPKEGNQSIPAGISIDPEVLRYLLIGFYAAGIIAIAYALRVGKMKAARTIGLYFGGSLLAVSIFFILLYFSEDIKDGVKRVIGTTSGGGGSGAGYAHTPAQANILLIIVIGIVIGCAIAGYVITSILSRKKTPSKEDDTRKLQARRLIDNAIRGIIRGDDPRSVVIRCYNEMCILVVGKGLHGFRALTPEEFKLRIKEELGVKGESLDHLTSLFEEAKYSHHFIGELHREQALMALNAFRKELGENDAR